MALKRLDVLVRKNSTVSQDYAVIFTKNFVNHRQSLVKSNIEYYADLFDSRTKKSWKIYSDKACDVYDIDNYYTTESGEDIRGVITLNSTDLTLQQLFDYTTLKPDTDNRIYFYRIPGRFICIWDTIKYRVYNKYIQLLEPIEKVQIFYRIIEICVSIRYYFQSL